MHLVPALFIFCAMWFLHIIPKNSHSSTVYSRLRPTQTYRLRSSHNRSSTASTADSVLLEVDIFTAEEVVNVRSRPSVHLKAGRVPIKIDNQPVDQTDVVLLDQQMIRINNSDTQYKLQWEEVGIYHIKSHDRPTHERLMEQGCKYGFHVVKELGNRTTTHYYIPDGTNIEPTKYLTFALLQNLIFVTDYWLTGLDVMDKGFNMQDYNEKTEPLRIENQGPIRRTAILGRDTRRATLFCGLEFWFFHDLQFKEFSMYIKLAGGKSRRCTFEEGQSATIGSSTLFVEPPTETQAFVPLRAKFHQETEVERCLLDWEIVASILYCSTNYTCNPKADIISHMSPDDLYYASLPTSMKPITIKQEPMSQSMADTLPVNTIPADEQGTVPADEIDTIPANEHDTVPVDERDTIPADESDTVPVDEIHTMLVRQYEDEDEDMDRKIVLEQPSYAFIASHHPEEHAQDYPNTAETSEHYANNNEDVEPIVKIEHIKDEEQDSPIAEFDFESQPMDVDDFFDNIFGNQIKERHQQQEEQAHQLQLQNQEQEEQAHQLQLQNQEQEEQAHQLQLQNQEQEEQAHQLQLQNQEQEEQARRLLREKEEYQRVQEEYDQDMERRRRELQQEEELEDNNHDSHSNNQEVNDLAVMDVDVQQVGEFTKVQYAPLIVKPRPPPTQQQGRTNSSGGVNYKTFKKVRQFQPESFVNVVCLATSSQRVRDNNNNFITRVQNTSQFDPDVAITVGRRRR